MQSSTPQTRKRKVDSISQLEGAGDDSEADQKSQAAHGAAVEQRNAPSPSAPPAKRPRHKPDAGVDGDETGYNVATADPAAFYHPSSSSSSSRTMSLPGGAPGKVSSLRHSGGLAKAPAKKISVNIRTSGMIHQCIRPIMSSTENYSTSF
jgi:hypothetical protein